MTTNVSLKGPHSKETCGTIALLNLPAYSVLSLDASASQTLKNEENLLVVNNIYPSSGLHLLVVRGNSKMSPNNGNGAESLSIGILILFPSREIDDGWFIARKFDAKTEEISSHLLDDISHENLRKSIGNRNQSNINCTRIIPYDRFLGRSNNSYSNCSENPPNCQGVWEKYLTNYVSIELLSKHGLTGKGDKIIPGAFTEDNKHIDANYKENIASTNEDGYTIVYPPIPHIGTNQSRSINSHPGTRRFLARLSPAERTEIFLKKDEDVASQQWDELIFEKVLSRYYDGNCNELLGQFQLSFVIFLCCSCLSSLEYWRDMIQMLSLINPTTLATHSQLFEQFLVILSYQLFSFENDLFNDQEIMNGNFLLPAIKQLCFKCINQSQNKNLEKNAILLQNKFETSFPGFSIGVKMEGNDINDDGDEEDEDGPIVVPLDEIEASIERSSQIPTYMGVEDHNKLTHASKYPFLFASMAEDEDILMTCARILDEKPDVTTVREAATFLEEVEATSTINKNT